MTRDEFVSLPPAIALGVLWDALGAIEPHSHLRAMPAPTLPRAPKYDYRLHKKDGFSWASETHLDSLRWWHQKATESAASGSQYAEKDAKKAQQLKRWIAWRVAFPEKAWRGERDNHVVTAAPPSHKPTVHQREQSQPQHEQETYETW